MEAMKRLRDDFDSDVPKTVEELTCESFNCLEYYGRALFVSVAICPPGT